MAVSDRERRELQEALVGTIGPDPADTLLGYLPPVGWADVATKHDVDHLGTELRLEMSVMKSDLRVEIAGLRTDLTTEIAGLRTDLTTDTASLRTALTTETAGLRADLTTETASLHTDLTTGLVGLRTETAALRTDLATGLAGLRTELQVAVNIQLRWMVSLLVLVVLTVIGTGILTR